VKSQLLNGSLVLSKLVVSLQLQPSQREVVRWLISGQPKDELEQ